MSEFRRVPVGRCAVLILLLLLSLGVGIGAAEGDEVQTAYRRLARTLNVDARDVEIRPAHLDAISDAGFSAIRLSENWTDHCEKKAPYRIDAAFFARMDRIVEQTLARHMAIIIDYHKDRLLTADPTAGQARFEALWGQIAEHYRKADSAVLFEAMAEPHDKLDAVWNRSFADVLAVIRRSNPRRAVLVGPSFYNFVRQLDTLELPPDPNLIVCIHTYRPLRFTFQGEDLMPGTDKWLGTHWTATAAECEAIRNDYDAMERWSKAHHRPLFVEEFGSSTNADIPSRARWTRFNRQEAERRGFSWGFWCFTPPFGIYDIVKGTWEPAILEALIPTPRK